MTKPIRFNIMDWKISLDKFVLLQCETFSQTWSQSQSLFQQDHGKNIFFYLNFVLSKILIITNTI